MADGYLSTDPNAGAKVADHLQSSSYLSQNPSEGTAGYWEDKGLAGKVWHSAQKVGPRQDNQVLGMPPELAVVAGLGVAKAVGSAAAGIGSKALAAAKGVVEQSAPAVKYEITKTGLRAIGVPASIAVPVAIAVSGYKSKGAVAPSAEAAEVVADVTPKVQIKADDFAKIKSMVEGGMTQADAIKSVLKARMGTK